MRNGNSIRKRWSSRHGYTYQDPVMIIIIMALVLLASLPTLLGGQSMHPKLVSSPNSMTHVIPASGK